MAGFERPMTASTDSGPPESRRVRRQGAILVGVLLTFTGLGLLALLIPSDPSGLARALPLAAGVVLALWAGGLLLGRAMGQRARRRAG